MHPRDILDGIINNTSRINQLTVLVFDSAAAEASTCLGDPSRPILAAHSLDPNICAYF